MLKTLSTLSLALLFTACSPSSNKLLPSKSTHTNNNVSPIPTELSTPRIVKMAIPFRENGYSNLQTQVLSSQNHLNGFISTIKQQTSWNQKNNFIKALTVNPIDFKKYNLLIYRITEGSGSTQVKVGQPQIKNQQIVIKINRKKAGIGTADMAYYALAYKVAKEVPDVTFATPMSNKVIKNQAIQTQSIR
ncbi:MAG: Unknown protein [uncultured Sulfurovum sp.]|uniref:Lipoprotein n=1 Tax=uncultured Sulfurovum sp. TaxID=269237 RepID=A0A6S6SDK2_9BACT|nr:MAG: Unknown protein [uncultured Sulfurovum sp.]